jgi:hydroxylamine reductase (hybrid-cluster protein)
VRSSLAKEKGNKVLLNRTWGPADDRNQVASLIDMADANSRALLHAVKQMIVDGNEEAGILGALDELIHTVADVDIRLN